MPAAPRPARACLPACDPPPPAAGSRRMRRCAPTLRLCSRCSTTCRRSWRRARPSARRRPRRPTATSRPSTPSLCTTTTTRRVRDPPACRSSLPDTSSEIHSLLTAQGGTADDRIGQQVEKLHRYVGLSAACRRACFAPGHAEYAMPYIQTRCQLPEKITAGHKELEVGRPASRPGCRSCMFPWRRAAPLLAYLQAQLRGPQEQQGLTQACFPLPSTIAAPFSSPQRCPPNLSARAPRCRACWRS